MERGKKKFIIILFVFVFLILVTGICIALYIKDANYKKTYDYKLKVLGYNEEEITEIKKLKDEEINIILDKDYDSHISTIIHKKYFLMKNLDEYLNYLKNNDKDLDDVIALVNTHAYKDWYTDYVDTDTSLNNLMLTNKYHKLSSDYEPDDLVLISNLYAYGENQQLRKDAYDAFINMFKDAKKEDITLIVNSSYRSYQEQEEIYNKYTTWYGEEETNKLAAKPGFSEHQTGLAVDIQTYNSNRKNFYETLAFKWLQDNAYKYGYILRYPESLEYLTGYDYESWHYRYVGIDVAKEIHDLGITFDEYYAYYLEK